MKITNKDVIQSYIITAAKYDFSVYEKRILFRLVELCQSQLKGQKLDSRFKISNDLYDDKWITMPISAFLKDDKDKNYTRVKEALRSLRYKEFEYEDDDIWQLISIIESPRIMKRSEFVEFRIDKKIYGAILDFSKGFRKLELQTAMSFESTYTMRFYELFSEKKEPIEYRIDHLKALFKLEDKYSRINDFFKRVIDPAKKELDKSSPYSFEFKPIKKGKKITSIKFYPIFNAKNRDTEIEAKKLKNQLSPAWELDKMTIDYLKQNYYFSSKEIQVQIDLFRFAERKLDFILFLSSMKHKCENKIKPKGYLINAIKKELKQK